MTNRTALLSYATLGLAIALWGGVWYISTMLLREADAQASETQIVLTKANQAALNQRVQSLAASTQDERAQLSALLSQDIVTTIDTIESVGMLTGTGGKVKSVEDAGQQPISDGDPIRAVTFQVEGTGTFAQVMAAAELYEKLPLLSTLDSVAFTKAETRGKVQFWNMNARVRVLTTQQISL